ncbi:MAG: SWIM zinc finger family protein [Verrucomicrobiae bacterium]
MSYYGWRPYVPVAKRRAQAQKKAEKFAKAGQSLSPVAIEGRTIAKTFWGKAWCRHLESFSDYENRLPRGRTYARNGSILDLQVSKGAISALVMGSELYEIGFDIKPLPIARWKAIKARSLGQIDSLVELLQGRFSDAVMRGITDRDSGLFPSPSEIKKTCSCPDWAGLCKHLAAVLYGIGARLDEKPELLFLLRGVDHLELLEEAPAGAAGPADIAHDDLADVFGIEIAEASPKTKMAAEKPPGKPKSTGKTRAAAEKQNLGASPEAFGRTGSVRSVAIHGRHGGRPSSNKAEAIFGISDPQGIKAAGKAKAAKNAVKKIAGPPKVSAGKPAKKPPAATLEKALLRAKSRARRKRLLKKKRSH